MFVSRDCDSIGLRQAGVTRCGEFGRCQDLLGDCRNIIILTGCVCHHYSCIISRRDPAIPTYEAARQVCNV